MNPQAFNSAKEHNADAHEGAGSNRAANRRPRSRGTGETSAARPSPSPSAALKRAAENGPGEYNGGQASPRTGIERTFAEREVLEESLQYQSEFWRQEVASRVEGYRIRRSRKRLSGEFSMRLDFESPSPAAPPEETLESIPPAPQAGLESGPAAAAQLPLEVDESNLGREAIIVSTAEPFPVEPSVPPAPSSPIEEEPPAPEHRAEVVQETKIIEFPRPLIFPDFEPAPGALAESVCDKPRILDVPEAVGAPPSPLADIALAPEGEEQEESTPRKLEVPLRVAPTSLRFTAGLMDLLMSVLGTAIFGMIALWMGVNFSFSKPLLAAGATIPLFFWALYHYLFLVYAGVTPGMAMARIRVCGFEEGSVPRSLRRWRALLMVLSAVSLGFGYLWVLFDEDSLCWHDKITRSYLAMEV